jgi:hypothetical protein
MASAMGSDLRAAYEAAQFPPILGGVRQEVLQQLLAEMPAGTKLTLTRAEDPPAYREFNINSNVKVKLTDTGRRILHEKGRSRIQEDAEGYSTWQLWGLMNTFGEHIRIGCEPPFETTIRLTNDRL